MEYVLLNKNLIERKEARIDFDDRGYYFGDGIYEVVRLYEKKFFTLSAHIERFYTSAKKNGYADIVG